MGVEEDAHAVGRVLLGIGELRGKSFLIERALRDQSFDVLRLGSGHGRWTKSADWPPPRSTGPWTSDAWGRLAEAPMPAGYVRVWLSMDEAIEYTPSPARRPTADGYLALDVKKLSEP